MDTFHNRQMPLPCVELLSRGIVVYLAPNYSLILVLVILLSILVLILEIEYRQLPMDSWQPKRR